MVDYISILLFYVHLGPIIHLFIYFIQFKAILMFLNALFGLPWLCAAPVRTLAHWASLSVYSTSHIPGVKPKLVKVHEQRLTAVLVHLSIGRILISHFSCILLLNYIDIIKGLILFAKPLLRLIPVPVLFGIILYFGVVSLSGTQLFERIKLIFIPFKYCPNVAYARGVNKFYFYLYLIFFADN